MVLIAEEKRERKTKYGLEFEEIPITGYEKVIKVTSREVRLTAIIALHNTVLGPALGGTRIQSYPTFEAALNDALRLSQGMTYKSAVSRVGWGGGKSVIIADPLKEKSDDLLMAFGEAVAQLEGKYICAEDVGCGTKDVLVMQRTNPFIVGLPHQKSSGDPSPYTAWGVLCGMQAALKKLYGSGSFAGRRVAIQGAGSVGACLADYLFRRGAELVVTDLAPRRAERLAQLYGAHLCSPREIYGIECDIFAPCALGAVLNPQTIPLLRSRAVVGAANNQLLRETDAEHLAKRGILYAPDFVVNAGGLINVSCELQEAGYDPALSLEQTSRIADQLLFIFENAERNGYTTQRAAMRLAEYNLRFGIGRRKEGKIYFHHSHIALDLA